MSEEDFKKLSKVGGSKRKESKSSSSSTSSSTSFSSLFIAAAVVVMQIKKQGKSELQFSTFLSQSKFKGDRGEGRKSNACK